jgi:hypothetical protein
MLCCRSVCSPLLPALTMNHAALQLTARRFPQINCATLTTKVSTVKRSHTQALGKARPEVGPPRQTPSTTSMRLLSNRQHASCRRSNLQKRDRLNNEREVAQLLVVLSGRPPSSLPLGRNSRSITTVETVTNRPLLLTGAKIRIMGGYGATPFTPHCYHFKTSRRPHHKAAALLFNPMALYLLSQS